MNKVTLIGRLTRDPEIFYSQGDKGEQMMIAKYTLAVERRYRHEGEQQADFIRCVAFRKSAEFAEKYFTKGLKIAVAGHIRTENYTNKDGVNIYTTNIIVEEQDFAESKAAADNRNNSEPKPEASEDGFMNIPDMSEDDAPF